MKGIVLAGGTATRLFPLTIVTNKHLLPIYDRPMIYYPIETLASMGIREVMVVVGGKSVGDVVELLGDGSHFGLDLTYRYQAGAQGIAQAIGLARQFVGDDAFCCVLGDNILRGPALADVAREFEDGHPRRGHAAVPRPGPGALRRRRAGRRTATSSASRRSPPTPRATSSRSACTSCARTRSTSSRHLAPSKRGEFEITDVLNHYIPDGRLFTRVYEGHWTDAGTVPSLLRAAELARDDDDDRSAARRRRSDRSDDRRPRRDDPDGPPATTAASS